MSTDRIAALERMVSELMRNTAGIPVRWASGGPGAGTDYRLIRGQSYGIQSGATVLIDNVVVLAGSLDPSDGDTAAQITVANIFGATYADNEKIDAVYSPAISSSPPADWETLKTTTGADQYRLIRGQCTADITADTASFDIDNIVILSNGLDPRMTPGDMAETLTIANNLKEAFYDNEYVTAIYSPAVLTDIDWELLVVERYRSIRGTWYSGTTTLVIDHIIPLESGTDPRTDPTDDTETVSVNNVAGDTYGSGDKVYADYNVSGGVWEARPKSASSAASGAYCCTLSGSVSAGSTSAWTAASSATIYKPDSLGALSTTPGTVYNPFSMSISPYSGEIFACVKFYNHVDGETGDDDKYVLVGQEPRQRLASLAGFGAEKILDVQAGSGGAPSDIQWEGAECS